MPSPKHIVIIAGEESGDKHAAEFLLALRAQDPTLRFSGIGGEHMRSAGVELIADLASYGVTGVTEVLRHAGVIYRAFRDIKAHLTASKPDLLILVDYPGFNLRLARFAKTVLGLKILYYISPQIWAWKAKRIHGIRRHVDKMAVIFPFEKKLYLEAGVPVSFVGHPLVDKLSPKDDPNTLKIKLKLPLNQPILAILPGSRQNEIKRHMPVLVKVIERLVQTHPNLHVVIPVAQTIAQEEIKAYIKDKNLAITFTDQQAVPAVYCADFVIVASGTASLECALLGKPMCIIYKASLFTYVLACKLIRVKYLGLCNLLSNRMEVPEFLQYDCNPDELQAYVSKHLSNPDYSAPMIRRLQALKISLSKDEAEMKMETLVAELLS